MYTTMQGAAAAACSIFPICRSSSCLPARGDKLVVSKGGRSQPLFSHIHLQVICHHDYSDQKDQRTYCIARCFVHQPLSSVFTDVLTVVCCQKTSNRDRFENPLRPYSISFSFPTSVHSDFLFLFFSFFLRNQLACIPAYTRSTPLQTTSNPGHTSSLNPTTFPPSDFMKSFGWVVIPRRIQRVTGPTVSLYTLLIVYQ